SSKQRRMAYRIPVPLEHLCVYRSAIVRSGRDRHYGRGRELLDSIAAWGGGNARKRLEAVGQAHALSRGGRIGERPWHDSNARLATSAARRRPCRTRPIECAHRLGGLP